MALTRKCQDAVGGELVGALDACWAEIRVRHPEVPAAVLITGAGTPGPRGGMRLGHFAASRWRTNGEAALGEVLVGGEGLARGARDVLATLLHEAADALADQRRIQHTSRQGRYHNQRFKRLAGKLGLDQGVARADSARRVLCHGTGRAGVARHRSGAECFAAEGAILLDSVRPPVWTPMQLTLRA
jgi:hypothetical protein